MRPPWYVSEKQRIHLAVVKKKAGRQTSIAIQVYEVAENVVTFAKSSLKYYFGDLTFKVYLFTDHDTEIPKKKSY